MAYSSERETHISMDKTSDKMTIYTTEYNVMHKLDRYVEESEEWKLISVSRMKGVVVAKTYEAPRRLLSLRKKTVVMSDEQREAAAERLRSYRLNQKEAEKKEETNTNTSEESAFIPQKTRPKYVKEEMFEPVR